MGVLATCLQTLDSRPSPQRHEQKFVNACVSLGSVWERPHTSFINVIQSQSKNIHTLANGISKWLNMQIEQKAQKKERKKKKEK